MSAHISKSFMFHAPTLLFFLLSFFTLDDDLTEAKVYDRDRHTMRPCSFELALTFAQQVMNVELIRKDDRYA